MKLRTKIAMCIATVFCAWPISAAADTTYRSKYGIGKTFDGFPGIRLEEFTKEELDNQKIYIENSRKSLSRRCKKNNTNMFGVRNRSKEQECLKEGGYYNEFKSCRLLFRSKENGWKPECVWSWDLDGLIRHAEKKKKGSISIHTDIGLRELTIPTALFAKLQSEEIRKQKAAAEEVMRIKQAREAERLKQQKAEKLRRQREAAEEAKRVEREKKRLEEMAERQERARLAAERKEREKDKLVAVGSGSGFAVNFEGLLVTNDHVVNQCEQLTVTKSGQEKRVKKIATDRINDLALLKIEEDTDVIFYISEDSPKVTEEVYVGGYPFGDAISSAVKVTKGIVSSLVGLENNYSNFMIDAALQPGNSGGPIFNEEGNLVGVAVAKLDVKVIFDMFDTIPEGTNFGIKNNVVREFLMANNVDIPTRRFWETGFSREALVDDGIFHILCYVKKRNIPKIKDQKVVFKKFQ